MIAMKKPEIIKLGLKLGAPLELHGHVTVSQTKPVATAIPAPPTPGLRAGDCGSIPYVLDSKRFACNVSPPNLQLVAEPLHLMDSRISKSPVHSL